MGQSGEHAQRTREKREYSTLNTKLTLREIVVQILRITEDSPTLLKIYVFIFLQRLFESNELPFEIALKIWRLYILLTPLPWDDKKTKLPHSIFMQPKQRLNCHDLLTLNLLDAADLPSLWHQEHMSVTFSIHSEHWKLIQIKTNFGQKHSARERKFEAVAYLDVSDVISAYECKQKQIRIYDDQSFAAYWHKFNFSITSTKRVNLIWGNWHVVPLLKFIYFRLFRNNEELVRNFGLPRYVSTVTERDSKARLPGYRGDNQDYLATNLT